MKGLFIAVEGPDGSGKSEQLRRLQLRLARTTENLIITREPWIGEIGGLLRRILNGTTPNPGAKALALLFVADRAEHLQHEVEPALARGAIVITDRYLLSTIAYQSVVGGLPLAWVEGLHEGMPRPDLTIVLDAEPTTTAKRRRARAVTEIYDDTATQSALTSFYRTHTGPGVVHVDAAKDRATVENEIWQAVSSLLTQRVTDSLREVAEKSANFILGELFRESRMREAFPPRPVPQVTPLAETDRVESDGIAEIAKTEAEVSVGDVVEIRDKCYEIVAARSYEDPPRTLVRLRAVHEIDV